MNASADTLDETPLAARLRSIPGVLTKSEAVISQWLILNEATLGFEAGASVPAKTGFSKITVSRFLRRAGCNGLQAALVYAHVSPRDCCFRLLDGTIGSILTHDAKAVLALAQKVEQPNWRPAIAAADEDYFVGFQTVRGSVRYISLQDGGLVEWTPSVRRTRETRCLVMFDMALYVREARPFLQAARKLGLQCVVSTDELNSWSRARKPFCLSRDHQG